jgi:hypothetical protein
VGRKRKAGSALVAAVFYLTLAVVAFWPVWRHHPTSDMQLGGDQWRNVWFLAWVPFALGHGLDPLFSAYANVPTGVNLLSGAGVPVLGLVFAPITLVWGPVATFNVVSTLALAGSAMAAYYLLRRLVQWTPAAFAGGLLYGFSPALVAQAMDGHINLSFEVMPPLILLVLHDLLITDRGTPRRRGVLLGLLVTAQFFISSEILFDTAIVALVGVVVAAVVGRDGLRERLRTAWRSLLPAAGVAVVLLAWPVWFLVRGPAHVAGKLQLVPQAYRSDVAGLAVPDSNQLFKIHGLLPHADQFSTTPGENGAYLGLTLLVALLLGVIWLRRDHTVIVATVAGIATFVLSLGGALALDNRPRITGSGGAAGRLPLPEGVFSHLPLLDNLVPGRLGILVALCAAVVLAVVLERLHSRPSAARSAVGRSGAHAKQGRRSSTVVIPALVAVVALVPLVPTLPFGGIGVSGTPVAYTSPGLGRPGVTPVSLVFPYPSNAFPQPLLWQAEADFDFKMPGGYFLVPQGPQHHLAFSGPLGYATDSPTGETLTGLAQGHVPARSPALRASLDAQLVAWRVTQVIATPATSVDPTASLAFLTWLLGPPTTSLAGGTDVWRSVRV